MLTPSDIFIELEYSTLVSDFYELMRHILDVICVTPYCNFNVPLLNTVLSKKGLYMESNICV